MNETSLYHEKSAKIGSEELLTNTQTLLCLSLYGVFLKLVVICNLSVVKVDVHSEYTYISCWFRC